MAEVTRRAELRRPVPPRKTTFHNDEEKIVVAGPDDYSFRSEKIFVPHVEADHYSHAQVWAPHHDDKIYLPPPNHSQYPAHHHIQHQYPQHHSHHHSHQSSSQGQQHCHSSAHLTDQKIPMYPDYQNPYEHRQHPFGHGGPGHGGPGHGGPGQVFNDFEPRHLGSRNHGEKVRQYSAMSSTSSQLNHIAELSPREIPHSDSFGTERDRTSLYSHPGSTSQTLSRTASTAASTAASVASVDGSCPVRIGKGDIWSTSSGMALFTMTRETRHDLSFLSSKPLLAVRRSQNNNAMGYIHFPKQTGSDIMMFINGQSTKISHSGLLHPRWEFASTSASGHDERWHWKRDKMSGGVVLLGGKKNNASLARMKGDLLYFDKLAKLTDANFDEIILSAIAIAEAVRRAGKDKDKDAGDRVANMLFSDAASIASATKSTFSEGAISISSLSSEGSERSARTAWSYS